MHGSEDVYICKKIFEKKGVIFGKIMKNFLGKFIILSWNNHTSAFVVDARIGQITISIAPTSHNANIICASLIRLTLVMIYARYNAFFVYTFLSFRTIGGRSTHG